MRGSVKGKLYLKPTDPLVLENTLSCGQGFRWKSMGKNVWRGVLENQILTLTQEEGDVISFEAYPEVDKEAVINRLVDYFNLNSSETLGILYQKWGSFESSNDIKFAFKRISKYIAGLRLLRQDPYESTFSFICSQNNNIARITQMIDKLCQQYGTHIGKVDSVSYYSFPSLKQLSRTTVADLRELGFGYRSKYLVEAVKIVQRNGGEKWLRDMRSLEYEKIRCELMRLPGVGPKIADCICLFSLDKMDLVPVDTHVWQIARRYIPSLSTSQNLSPRHHPIIRQYFKTNFGAKAGWAHTILFAAELASFKKKIQNDFSTPC